MDNDQTRDLRKHLDSFKFKAIGNIRKFSTSSYNSLRSKNNEGPNNQDSVLCKLGDGTQVIDNLVVRRSENTELKIEKVEIDNISTSDYSSSHHKHTLSIYNFLKPLDISLLIYKGTFLL